MDTEKNSEHAPRTETLIVLRLSEGSKLLEVNCHTCMDLPRPDNPSGDSTHSEEPATMRQGRFEPGWMERQFNKAQADVDAWPEWKKRLAGLDQETQQREQHTEPQSGRSGPQESQSR